MRRAVLVLILATACGPSESSCRDDSECSADTVCARDGLCREPSAVRTVRVTWTVGGQPASTATCATIPSLALLFYGLDRSDSLGFAPVPCSAGLFSIDKLPTRFGSVEIGAQDGAAQAKVVGASGNVVFDLVP